MVRCCHCAVWYHEECIRLSEEYVAGIWPCFECRKIPADISELKNELVSMSQLMKTLTDTVGKLHKDHEIIVKDLKEKDKSPNKLLVENTELRERLSAVHRGTSAAHWENLSQASKTAVFGSSIIRDIDEGKLLNTTCICIPGGKSRTSRKL